MNFVKTKIPSCTICDKNMVKVSECVWKHDCEHMKEIKLGVLGVMKGLSF